MLWALCGPPMQALLHPRLLTKYPAVVASGRKPPPEKPQGDCPGRPALTSHFSFRENKVVKKKRVQMTGQMISPSQKIRASTSVGGATLDGPSKEEKSK